VGEGFVLENMEEFNRSMTFGGDIDEVNNLLLDYDRNEQSRNGGYLQK
jgi:hypothetical protein